jgi:hypothetical protein
MFLAAFTAPATWFVCRNRGVPTLVGFFVALILGSAFSFGTSFVYGLELEREMYRFDLNGDKEFSEQELTAEANAAIKRWSSDTGRSFALITAPIVSLLWTSTIFAAFWGISLMVHLIRNRNENGA